MPLAVSNGEYSGSCAHATADKTSRDIATPLERIDRMIHDRAVPRGWPRDLAESYLKERLDYAATDEHMAGLEMFHRKAHEHGMIPELRPLETV